MSYKVPVLLSKVAETIYVARVVDGPDGEAIGATPAEAMSHLQKHLRDIARQDAYAYWPEVQDVELKYCELRVRLFYRDGNKRFPASELLKLPVRYVVGIYSDGSVECFLPDWEREFFCPDRDELDSCPWRGGRRATNEVSTGGAPHHRSTVGDARPRRSCRACLGT